MGLPVIPEPDVVAVVEQDEGQAPMRVRQDDEELGVGQEAVLEENDGSG